MPTSRATQKFGKQLGNAQRQLRRDWGIAIIATALLSGFFIHTEAFEIWYQFSRTHEDWEMDEFACIVFASAFVGTLMLLRHLRLIRRLLMHADATEKLRQRESEALARQERMAALGKLSGGMAHEINNALQPVLGLGDFVLKELEAKGSDKHVKYMELILSSARHTKGIIENVLNYTRERTLDMESEPIAQAVPTILHFATDMLQSMGSFKFEGIDQLEAPENKNYTLFYSKTGLRQVFVNLIKNASESMKNSGTVTIRVAVINPIPSEGKATLAIRVIDHGCGMNEETRNRVFQPFFTTKDISEGTGLGLSSALGVVEMHKGMIRVETVLNEGSTFSVLLPISTHTPHLS